MLQPVLQQNLPLVIDLFRSHGIKRAFAFGSVCTDRFNEQSDIDLLVSFDDSLDPVQRGENWWDLYYALKNLLHREIDLITENSLENPYLIKEINLTKHAVYGQ